MLSHGLFFTVLGYEHFWYFLAESLAAEEGVSLSHMERSVLFFAVAVAAVPVFLILAAVSQNLLLLLLLLLLFRLVTLFFVLLLLLVVAAVAGGDGAAAAHDYESNDDNDAFLQLRLSHNFPFLKAFYVIEIPFLSTIIFSGHCVGPRFPPA